MYRIMIVEDDEVIANAIRQHLVSWGMEAFCVQDFSDVLSEFAATGPQLVLMDIHLPFFKSVIFIIPWKAAEMGEVFVNSPRNEKGALSSALLFMALQYRLYGRYYT